MSLPTLSTLNTTQDTNKQLSIIRSYLVQLKDELEAELSNVTYEMLSASLQKRIDSISDDIAGVREENYINAQMITADSAKIGTISADYVKASTLASAVVNTGILNAYMIKTTYCDVNGKIKATELDTQFAKVGELSAYMLESTYISGGMIKADKISADAFSGRTVTAKYFDAQTGFTHGGYDFGAETITYKDGNGVTRTRVFLTGHLR